MISYRMIVAFDKNFLIGAGKNLPWRHFPEDMARFKRITLNHTVLMGRKTWESLPDKSRPLPDRKNFVLTNNPDYVALGATVVRSFEEFESLADGEVYVIGGKAIFDRVCGRCDKMYLTCIDDEYEGDTYLSRHTWRSFKFLHCQFEKGGISTRGMERPIKYKFYDLVYKR